jgi:curved DNA-binding protein CbpA
MVERRSTDDLYAVVGVEPHASADGIVRAYRRLALTAHPDARPADPGATVRFRKLTHGYDVLSDPTRRAEYDRTHLPDKSTTITSGASRPPPPRAPFPRSQRMDAYSSDSPTSLPPLWVGPVHVEPLMSRRIGVHRAVHPRSAFAELTGLLGRYLDALSTGRWL